jgi:hypothetical protein
MCTDEEVRTKKKELSTVAPHVQTLTLLDDAQVKDFGDFLVKELQ